MPAPAVMIDRETVEVILEHMRFLPGEAVEQIRIAVEMADREYDGCKADAAAKATALKS